MDACVKDFCDAMAHDFSPVSPLPVEPVAPTTQDRYIYNDTSVSTGVWYNYVASLEAQYNWPEVANDDLSEYIRAGEAFANSTGGMECYEWWLYRSKLAVFNAALTLTQQHNQATIYDQASLVARIKQDQASAASLHDQIYGEYQRRLTNLSDLVTGAVNAQNMLGVGGMVAIDPDKLIDTRFYVVTHVTDWGWESAPSPVSASVDVAQNDTVTVRVPRPPDGRQIQKWRVYRSNVGTQDAAYQFVKDVLVADEMSYVDMVASEDLGEVCPTFGWVEPPYRWDNSSAQEIKPPKGDDPFLRGLVAMPNGVLAGYIDNYVAFCDPYHPYAWPVDYQITTDTPIVGLGVFGQSLFVGTMGNPYVISGADSASMSAPSFRDL
jgi:hypothetical protein